MSPNGRSPSRCIIFNPAAGRGLARRRIARLQQLHRPGDDFQATSAPGAAEELALRAVQQGFDIILAAGGDGTVHEAANGVLRSDNSNVVFAPWPIGSANDYAFALGLPADWPLRSDVNVQPRRVDAGEIHIGNQRRFFVNGMGLGFNAAVTLESRNIPRLRGLALYGLAFIKAVARRYRYFDLTTTIDAATIQQSTLALTINLGPREGGFIVTPQAKLDDGYFDIVQAGPLSRWQALTMLPRLANGSLPRDNPAIRQCHGQEITIRCSKPVPIHLDGELLNHSEVEISIRLLPKVLTVLTTSQSGYLVS